MSKAKVLTASAVRGDTKSTDDRSKRLTMAWQDRALAHYDETPEAWFAGQFYARPLSKLRLFPAKRDANGVITEIKDADARGLLERIKDPAGGHSELLENYGRLMFLIGDGYLSVTERDGEEVWEFLSPNEFKVDGDGIRRIKAPSLLPINLDNYGGDVSGELPTDEVVMWWRFWKSHPKHSLWPDSPMKAVLGPMDQLALLDRTANARLISRLAGSGILAVADEISFPSDDGAADEADQSEDDIFDLLEQHILAPIQNPGAASQLIPFVLRLTTLGRPIGDLIQHLKLYDPNESFPEMERQRQLIERIAFGLDMPPEELTGVGQTNHWNGWQVSEDSWKAHQEPLAIKFVNDLTTSYFRQAAIEEEITDAEELIVWFDPSKVVVHPDRGKDADAVHDRGELNGKALREAHGFDDTDRPSEDERRDFVMIKLRDMNMAEAVYGEHKVAPSGAGTDKEPPDEPPAASQNGDRAMVAANVGPHGLESFRLATILGAAESSVTRARSLAGAKLRTRSRGRCEECARKIDGVESSQVAAVLGREMLSILEAPTPQQLVDGAAEEFVTTAARLGLEQSHAVRLGEQIEKHAARTLLDSDPPSLPSGFGSFLERVIGE